jgi:hypothetical protein
LNDEKLRLATMVVMRRKKKIIVICTEQQGAERRIPFWLIHDSSFPFCLIFVGL